MAKRKTAPRKVAIVGTAQSSARAPINDPSWSIWGVGYRGDHITRCDRWFEIHRLDALKDGPEWRPLLRKWAKDCELVMFWPEKLGPKVMQYPVEKIKQRFGTYFMTSSLAWMLALAIDEHDTNPIAEIGVWGVDMEFGTEYREQRDGMRHFLALARFAGIPTRLQVDGGIVYEPVPYPFWMDDPLTNKLKLRKEVAEGEIAQRERVIKASERRLAHLDGILSTNPKDRDKIDRERDALRRAEPSLREEVRFYKGALEEIVWSQDYLRP